MGRARTSSWAAFGVLVSIAFGAASPVLAVFTIGSPQQIGTISNGMLNEISGLVDSRANSNTFWVHNDSGDSARFFAMSRAGNLLGTFSLAGASASDWEDIAIGPQAGGGNYLYLGDIGDNTAERSSISIHRVVEPLSTSSATIAAGSYKTLNLKYPNGARDVESMFVDPISNELYLITKRRAVPEVYSVPVSAFDDATEPVTLTALGSFSKVPLAATAADISPDGRYIAIRSSSTIPLSRPQIFERLPGQSVADALQVTGVSFALGSESQGEAIGWAADGKSFFTASEFDGDPTAPIHSYSFTVPKPMLAGDYNDDQVVDAADFTVWRDLLGSMTALPNESETPGSVTKEDFDAWRAHFGETLVVGAAVAVPEPASWALVAIASPVLLAAPQIGHSSPAADFQRRRVLVLVHHEVLAMAELLGLGWRCRGRRRSSARGVRRRVRRACARR